MPIIDITGFKNVRNQLNLNDGNNLLINAGLKSDGLFCGFEIYAANTGSVYIDVKKFLFQNKKILIFYKIFPLFLKTYHFPYIGNYNFLGDKLNDDPSWFPIDDNSDTFPPYDVYSDYFNVDLIEGYNYYSTPCVSYEKNVFFYMWSDIAENAVAVNTTGLSRYPDYVMNWNGNNFEKINPSSNYFFSIKPVFKYNYYKSSIPLKTVYKATGGYSITAKTNISTGFVQSQKYISVTTTQGIFL